jgi:uncharacterized repeat protein (TIGR01451 family)
MKKIYLLLLLVAGFADAQIVNIPNAAFKAELISSMNNVDTNNDGEIQVVEAEALLSLTITSSSITNMTGLEAFSSLTYLFVMSNQLTSINLSGNTHLRILRLTTPMLGSLDTTNLIELQILELNQAPLIASLDLSTNLAMDSLEIQNLAISTLNLTGLVNLTNLRVNGTPNLVSLVANDLPLLRYVNVYLQTPTATFSFSNCPSITSLSFFRAQSLDLSNCSSLTNLMAIGGDLQFLNVTGCTALANLDCGYNQLTTLDLTTNINLKDLTCHNNALTTLDLTNNVNLESAYCRDNNIAALDISNCPKLTSLNCANNQLTFLDANSNINLTTLDCSGMPTLETLFVKNGKSESVYFGGNQGLRYICADLPQFATILFAMNSWTNPPEVGDYCSFTPGGNYNTITGSMRFDHDNNGCSSTDIIPIYTAVGINDGTATGATAVVENGSYNFYTGAGNFTVMPHLEQADYFNVNPVAATASFPLQNSSVETRDFCLTANGIHPDTEIILMASGMATPGFMANYLLIARNKGNQAASGTIDVNFNGALLDFVAASNTPTSQTANTLSWNYSDLLPFEVRVTAITMRINSPTENPPVQLGDVLDFGATINIPTGDNTPDDNAYSYSQTVVNSYDPNDKTCLEGASILPENIGKYLHYNINFENTGTADAINVVVKDTIDTTRFDINSLQLLYASHPVYPKITGNVVEFIFEGINLPPSIMNPIGGHGNVLFKIKTLPTLTVGDEVSNTANIYFDYNAPIDTNEARTAFNNLSKTDFIKDNSVTVYPNPAKNKVTVKATGLIKSVQLYDVQGRILQSVVDRKSPVILDISRQQSGVYFLRIITDKGSDTQKIIKE